MRPRLRVLLSSFAFSPFDGSEGGVGWETATRLAQWHDVTVLCGDVASARPAKRALARYFQDQPPIPGLTIHYVDPPLAAQVLEAIHSRPGLWALDWVAYGLWQRQALAHARALQKQEKFDAVHQLTYASYRAPGLLWRLATPFFWGPVGGAADVPAAFRRTLNLNGRWRMGLRNAGNWFQRNLAQDSSRAARRARVVWVGGHEERRVIERWGGTAEYLLQTGTNPVSREPRHCREGEPLRIVWSGMHVSGKALPLLLHAIARLKGRPTVEVEIIGDGPETSSCRAMASHLGLDSMVRWHGKVPRTEALAIMDRAHVLVHSSLKEGTPSVITEALSLGLPVICHDVSGMALAVTADCGITVPLIDPETSIAGFTAAIERLANDGPLYEALSAGALVKARQLAWSQKILRFSDAYREAAAGPKGGRHE
jgi:glycosyltransferase involved in cell wall biosynthesis